jgi:hypothetical protein
MADDGIVAPVGRAYVRHTRHPNALRGSLPPRSAFPPYRVSLHRPAWVKIEDTAIDRSLGDKRACRHPILSPEDAKALRGYYGQSAEAFTMAGDSERARVCAEAEANVRYALRVAGISI